MAILKMRPYSYKKNIDHYFGDKEGSAEKLLTLVREIPGSIEKIFENQNKRYK